MKTMSRFSAVILALCATAISHLRADETNAVPATAPAPVSAPAPVKVNIDRQAFKNLTFSADLMNLAMSQKMALRGDNKLQNGAQKQSYGFYLNALMVSLNPDVKAPDGRPVADQLLVQIRDLIAPGHEPNAGAGLNGWTHQAIAQAFVLIKYTPEVWGKLTDDEKNRMDWIMKAMAVAGHFQMDDGNNYNTSLHADDNCFKGWNPNHRLYLLVVICAAAYFGPDQLNDIYTSFSYDDYMKEFDQLGFTNIKAVWSCYDWKPILENGGPYTSPKKNKEMGTGTGVKHPFTYQKIPLTDLSGIFCVLAQYCYSETVTNGVDGKSWILNNGTSPVLGQPGMFKEFNSKDAEGIRSDLDYCSEDFCSYTIMLMTLKVLGLWPDTEQCKNTEKLMYVGNEDFLYKNATGFHSFSHGKGRDSTPLEQGKWLGFGYVLEIWNNFLKTNIKPQ